MTFIDELARAALASYALKVERALEQAIAGGEHGVLITWSSADDVTAEVDPSVPYGYAVERRVNGRFLPPLERHPPRVPWS